MLRQASATTIDARMSERLERIESAKPWSKYPAETYWETAFLSLLLTSSLPSPGNATYDKHTSTVKTVATYTGRFLGLDTHSLSPHNAMNGTTNSTTTKMLATVRNFEYIGTWSMKKSVNGMKLRPQPKRSVSKPAASMAHFIGFLLGMVIKPSTKSIQTSAPRYTGPLVPGCSPQYWVKAPYTPIWLI